MEMRGAWLCKVALLALLVVEPALADVNGATAAGKAATKQSELISGVIESVLRALGKTPKQAQPDSVKGEQTLVQLQKFGDGYVFEQTRPKSEHTAAATSVYCISYVVCCLALLLYILVLVVPLWEDRTGLNASTLHPLFTPLVLLVSLLVVVLKNGLSGSSQRSFCRF